MATELKLDAESSVSIDEAKYEQTKFLLAQLGIHCDLISAAEKENYMFFITWLRELNDHLLELLPTQPLMSHTKVNTEQAAQEYFRAHVVHLFAQYFYTQEEAIYEFLQVAYSHFVRAYEVEEKGQWAALATPENRKLAARLLTNSRFSPFLDTSIINTIFNHDVFTNPLSTFIGYLAYIADQGARV